MATWQLSRRALKRFKVGIGIILTLGFLYILPSILVSIPAVQRLLAQRASEELTKLFHAPVSLEAISIDGWRNVSLKQIAVLDSLGRPALSSREIKTRIELERLLTENRVYITSARLFDLNLLVDVDSATGRTNVQHILDALSSDSEEPSTLTVDLNNILMRNASLSLLRNAKMQYRLEHINMQASQLLIAPDSLLANLDELSFDSPSGLKLKNLEGKLKLKDSRLSITQAEAQLEHSSLKLESLKLNLRYPGLAILEEVRLPSSELNPQDLAPLYLPLKDLADHQLSLSVHLTQQSGFRTLALEHFDLRLQGLLQARLTALISLDSLGALQGVKLDAEQLSVDLKHLSERRLMHKIPQTAGDISVWVDKLKPLGQIDYQGQSDYRVGKDFVTSGLITTALGRWTLQGDGEFDASRLSELSARIGTSGFDLKPLLGSPAGHVRGEVAADLIFPKGSTYPVGKAQLDLSQLSWGGSTYRGVTALVEGNKQNRYQVMLKSQDPSLPLRLTGAFRLQQDQPKDIEAHLVAHNLRLASFVKGLDHAYVESHLSLSSLDLNQLSGELSFPTLRASIEGKALNLSDSYLSAHQVGQEQRLRLKTPWLNLVLSGRYNLKTLKQDILATLTSEIPVLQPIFGRPMTSLKGANQFSLSAEIDSIPQEISQLIGLPIKIKQTALISANIDSYNKRIDYALNCNELGIAGHRIEGVSMTLNSHHLTISGDAYLYGGTQLLGARLEGLALENKLELASSWGRDSLGNENGSLNLVLDLFAPEHKQVTSLRDLNAILSIDHSNLRIHTALWDVAPAKVTYAGGALRVEGLSLSTQGRRLSISGGLGDWQGLDGMTIQLQNINLRYILEAAGVYFDLIDTDLTGTIMAKLEGKNLNATAQVTSPSFFVNKQDVGAIDMRLGFSLEDMLIRLNGHVKQRGGGSSRVDGWIKPEGGAGLDLAFDAHRLQLGFISSFLDSFMSLEGLGTGKMRLHGLFEEGVTVSGDADIAEGKIGVKALGTHYRFEQPIHLNDSTIFIKQLVLSDEEGNKGVVDGYIRHQYFGNFQLDLGATIDERLKVLQTTTPKDFPAYGNAYASGKARMKGTDQHLSIDVNLESQRGTDVRLDFEQLSAGRDERLMSFTRLRPGMQVSADTLQTSPSEEIGTDIDLNLKLNITPQARIGMRLGEDENSLLTGRGEGAIQIIVPSSGTAEVYGTAQIHEGEYVFTLQQLARKRFVVREGGSIAFRGNPMRATLHGIQAVYPLTANIADLDETLSRGMGQTNIPVNCILALSGEISRPSIRFDLELPRADAEMERRVKALLNTEDAITRQMLYLIALGKFYTNDADRRSTTTTNDWTAVASSAISEQLSSILGRLTEVVRLGTSIKTKSTAFDDTDIELNFSSSLLDNRLTINGNIGYHDNPYLTNQYLGEFDIEYKLNKSGSLRLKGYNHYNTMYQYLRQSLLTQGLGILYRQRFDKLSELLPFSRRTKNKSLIDSLKTDSLPAKP